MPAKNTLGLLYIDRLVDEIDILSGFALAGTISFLGVLYFITLVTLIIFFFIKLAKKKNKVKANKQRKIKHQVHSTELIINEKKILPVSSKRSKLLSPRAILKATGSISCIKDNTPKEESKKSTRIILPKVVPHNPLPPIYSPTTPSNKVLSCLPPISDSPNVTPLPSPSLEIKHETPFKPFVTPPYTQLVEDIEENNSDTNDEDTKSEDKESSAEDVKDTVEENIAAVLTTPTTSQEVGSFSSLVPSEDIIFGEYRQVEGESNVLKEVKEDPFLVPKTHASGRKSAMDKMKGTKVTSKHVGNKYGETIRVQTFQEYLEEPNWLKWLEKTS